MSNEETSRVLPLPPSTITYYQGDATSPNGPGSYVIAHICNDVGGWGKGFVRALSRRWEEPEAAYRAWKKSSKNFELGNVQLVTVSPTLHVANMIAQHGYATKANPVVVEYAALHTCLQKIASKVDHHTTIVMPRIGCGLAGGTWDLIEPIIRDTLCASGVAVEVYDLP
jgi:O-acetyl-ADP-ribose deacetylase (regulator of RNase III)